MNATAGVRPRLTPLLIAAAIVMALTTATPVTAASASGPPDRDITVINYNIGHGGTGLDGVYDLGRIADVIADADADIVTLQEVDRTFSARSDFDDQAAWLARELGMHVVYGANLDLTAQEWHDIWGDGELDPEEAELYPRRQYGTATLSKHPILTWKNTLLPILDEETREEMGLRPRSEQRGLLEAHIKVRGVPVTVYNTHLHHDNVLERSMQVDAVADIAAVQEGLSILTGDLNAEPEDEELAPLFELYDDVWDLAGGDDPGYTFPTRDPEKRIDFVLTSSEITVHHAEVPYEGASDHLPLVVDLSLPGSHVGSGG